MFQRSASVLGLEVLRTLMHDQTISIVGVGGLGSIIAEHLIHMGFQALNLIDPDVLELSNLNRVVGAYYEDAQQQRAKVDGDQAPSHPHQSARGGAGVPEGCSRPGDGKRAGALRLDHCRD